MGHWFYASAGNDFFRFTSLQDSYSNAAECDVILDFDAATNQFIFADAAESALMTPVEFIGRTNRQHKLDSSITPTAMVVAAQTT
jgi:hypothetical protein